MQAGPHTTRPAVGLYSTRLAVVWICEKFQHWELGAQVGSVEGFLSDQVDSMLEQ